MLNEFLKKNIKSQAAYVEYGYGQVEPNHLSAQRNGQVYGQLPADKDIEVLEQGQFVKYDYAKGVCDFSGEGEWMLVFNEIKLYRDHQMDCEFALRKGDYQARVYSPAGELSDVREKQSRYYNGVDSEGKSSATVNGTEYKYDDVTAPADMYEVSYNEDPFHILSKYKEKLMPAGTTMVPRVLKTMPGDIYTTNLIDETELTVGEVVSPRAKDGILVKTGGDESMKWQIVKVYTMPDHQKGVKLMRIA